MSEATHAALYASYLTALDTLKAAQVAVGATYEQFEQAHNALMEYEERLEDLCR